jgi:tyrosinase
MAVINVFKELYRNGVMDRFSSIHARYWPQTHKPSETIIWHRWFLNEFEKEMRKIDPQITLPYWVISI